ncbi:hypothetical protein [Pseudomonas aeruginosa]|uniref:hypothetical protein n=1 Tax=Pseudomonas aeruginosa TaxID=287 RepID=UPI0032B335BF
MPSMLTASDKDKATARRFLDGCYEDAVGLPSQAQMERLIALGWVERVPGGYAETPVLRCIDLH